MILDKNQTIWPKKRLDMYLSGGVYLDRKRTEDSRKTIEREKKTRKSHNNNS